MRNTSLLLLLLLTVQPALSSEFLQLRVELFPPGMTTIPGAPAVPSDWDQVEHPERGPVPDLKLMAHEPGGAVWLGGPMGAARFDPAAIHPWDRWRYFQGRRYLADDLVQFIVVENDAENRTVWVQTETGLSRLEWVPMTLEKKAEHYEELIRRHHTRLGFISDNHLKEPGNLNSGVTHDNDNDGLWSAMYLAAQSYRHGATGDPEALDNAGRVFDALVNLHEITGHPGFPARSIVRKGDSHDAGEWHPSTDGSLLWKADTSSDELVGHYYGFAVFYDLAANGTQKKTIRKLVRAMTDHLIRNNYELVDLDGKPTLWGQWSESFFQTKDGRYERALRSIELLGFLNVAFHVTGDPKYLAAHDDRVGAGYADFTLEYRNWPEGGEINFSDDELAFLSRQPLLQYERDAVLRRKFLAGVKQTWRQIASDRNPLWNYIAMETGAVPVTDTVKDDSRRTLERIPWSLVEWKVTNSRRIDVTLRTDPDRFGLPQLHETLPPDERPQHKWNNSPYQPDGGADGLSAECGTYFLLPYWMGRYHGWVM